MIQIKKNNQKLFTQKEDFTKDLYLNQLQISRFLKQLKNRFYLFLKKNHFLPFKSFKSISTDYLNSQKSISLK